MKEIMVRSMNYEKLTDLFERSGLEIHRGDKAPGGLLTCFEMIDEDTNTLLGASGICLSEGEYILRCVAVEENYRGYGYGVKLVDAVMEEAKSRKAKRIWLTAKVPEFYTKFGFSVVPREEAPFESACGTCPQYHNGCESEVMVYWF